MALILADRVRETSTTTGTGALSLAGAVVGYQTFSSAIGNTNTCYYAISNPGVAEWEVGIGTYATSGNTLTRTTILKSSNSNAAVNFSAGTKDVFVTYPAGKSVYLDASGNASALGTPASGTVTNLTGTASININGTVGATTPSTGAFTTLSATTAPSAGLNKVASFGQSTDNRGVWVGTDATGNALVQAYRPSDGNTATGFQLALGYANAAVATVTSTGLAVTGTLTSTGNASFSTSTGGILTIGTASPSAWATGNYKGIEINGGASFIGFVGNAQTYMLSNLYGDGTNYRYITASGGGLYAIQGVSSGAHVWYSAPSGSAGAIATVTQTMTLDSSGNLGLGVTPSASFAGYKTFQIASQGVISSDSTSNGELEINNNSLRASGSAAPSYINSFAATKYNQYRGVHAWYNAPSGTAGNAITFTQAMTLDASGNLGIGTTAPVTRLQLGDGSSGQLKFRIHRGAGTDYTEYFSDTGSTIIDTVGGGDIYLRFNGTSKMSVLANGIVTMNAYGAGAATFSASGVISSVSDETWKVKDGAPVDPDAMLNKLEPGYWYYNDEKKETFGKDRQLGFYAQNVNAAIGPEAAPEPETVVTKNDDGTETSVTKPWGYYDRSVLAVTVMSLQKALATIESLTARITALEAK